MAENPELEYVGFWLRVWASVIDSVLVVLITVPLVLAVYGRDHFLDERMLSGPADFLISYVLPAIAIIAFWVTRGATPGKMAIGAKIVDERTGEAPRIGQSVVRYLGYFVSMIPLFLGMIWVGFDSKKQGWHDKMAGTVVVRARDRSPEPVRFGG